MGYPQLNRSDAVLTGETVIASTGQSRTHNSHSIQSSTYRVTAVWRSSSMRITSQGQLFTHFAQPMHTSGSITATKPTHLLLAVTHPET
jgi:hypothetical protein